MSRLIPTAEEKISRIKDLCSSPPIIPSVTRATKCPSVWFQNVNYDSRIFGIVNRGNQAKNYKCILEVGHLANGEMIVKVVKPDSVSEGANGSVIVQGKMNYEITPTADGKCTTDILWNGLPAGTVPTGSAPTVQEMIIDLTTELGRFSYLDTGVKAQISNIVKPVVEMTDDKDLNLIKTHIALYRMVSPILDIGKTMVEREYEIHTNLMPDVDEWVKKVAKQITDMSVTCSSIESYLTHDKTVKFDYNENDLDVDTLKTTLATLWESSSKAKEDLIQWLIAGLKCANKFN